MRTDLNKIQRCPGCGNFLIHIALKQAIQELNIPHHMVVVVTGIWCNSKMNQYMEGYAAETLHGRGLAFANGVKLANPALTVISISGDGDSYGIGIGHLIHTARRDTQILHITCDNENYALTTGQASATTPLGIKTLSTPQGNVHQPMHSVHLVAATGCRFVKSVVDKDIKTMKEAIIAGIQHPWFAHLHVEQACPSWKRW